MRMRDARMVTHSYAANQANPQELTMAKHNVAQLEYLSQQLTKRFRHLEDLMSQSWLEHELIRGDLRDLFSVYYRWLGEEGIEHERH